MLVIYEFYPKKPFGPRIFPEFGGQNYVGGDSEFQSTPEVTSGYPQSNPRVHPQGPVGYPQKDPIVPLN